MSEVSRGGRTIPYTDDNLPVLEGIRIGTGTGPSERSAKATNTGSPAFITTNSAHFY
jgi:hypothetical protein